MGNYQNTPIKGGFGARTCGGTLSSGMIFGLLLITGGTLLFIDNLGILPVDLTDAFWPIVLLVFSSLGLYRTRSFALRVWCVTGVVASVLLILGAFHVIRANSGIIWPLVLIATGIVLLVYRLRWRHFTERVSIGTSSAGRTADNKLQEAAVFSAIKRRVETPNFEGGELNAVFGSVEIDLRHAGIHAPDRTIALEANAVFGGIEIRIPENWKLTVLGTAVFGTYEDKTIPPRPEPGVTLPTLIIRGGTAFGSVIIRN
jgi:predicted membrane protein